MYYIQISCINKIVLLEYCDTDFRWDMSKPMDFWETHDCRSLKDIQDCALKNQFSCQHKPLLEVKLENVVLDELHLMLRITGQIMICLN
jgi:hypothetical protein